MRRESAGTRIVVWCALVMAWPWTAPAAELPGQPAEPPSQLDSPASQQSPLTSPQIPTPPGQVPSPIAPSKVPSGALSPVSVSTVAEFPGSFVEFRAADVRTTYADGAPALTVATGMVTAHWKDVYVTADRGQADYRTNLAGFEGNVTLWVGAQEARGDRIDLNMRTGEWSVGSAKATISPEFVRGYILAPLYASSRILQGVRTRQVSATEAKITSCNLAEPHYELVSQSVTVYPGDKIVFRHASAYILGRRLVTLRRLVVPIRDIERNPNLVPTIGQSAEEGAYLRTAYSYMGSRTQTGTFLLDLMQRKGVGYGLRHNYKLSSASGELQAYFLRDRNIGQDTFTGRFTHDQQLGTLKLSLSSDFRTNSYLYAPNSKTLINRLQLTRDRPGANTSLSVTQTVNDVFTRTTNLSGSVRHRQLWGEDTSLGASFDYLAFNSFGNTRARLTSDVLFSRKEDKFDWSLEATKLTDLSDEAFVGGGTFAGIERLPELALMTDTARLGNVLPLGIPARLKVSYGKFAELPANRELDRTYIEIVSPSSRHTLSKTWALSTAAGFRQYLYSDDTAQYSIDAGLELRKQLGEKSEFAMTYRYQQPRGYTPFRFDYVGRYNVLNAGLNVRETERFKLSVLTGYNFEQSRFPWQDVVLRCLVQPTPSFVLYTATSYDVNNSRWRTLINQFRIRAGEGFKLDIGTRYDPNRGKLASVRTQLDTRIGPKWRLQALAGYNGISGQFDYRSVMLTRDLHCWEASIAFVDQGGFYNNKGVFLNIRIKAFPLFQGYGIGSFGQALDTSVGQVY